jgi:hypothetical protein
MQQNFHRCPYVIVLDEDGMRSRILFTGTKTKLTIIDNNMHKTVGKFTLKKNKIDMSISLRRKILARYLMNIKSIQKTGVIIAYQTGKYMKRTELNLRAGKKEMHLKVKWNAWKRFWRTNYTKLGNSISVLRKNELKYRVRSKEMAGNVYRKKQMSPGMIVHPRTTSRRCGKLWTTPTFSGQMVIL